MKIEETPLKGAFIIEPETIPDERGFFARIWSEAEFSAYGINTHFVEGNFSFNRKAGTLRGMHYQASPFGQAKLVRCTRGAIVDVGIDLRPDSATFRQWFKVELSAENHRMIYLPGEFAHGFQTLTDNTEVYYQVTAPYEPSSTRGVRWNDPAFNVIWPEASERIIIQRDRDYPDFTGEP